MQICFFLSKQSTWFSGNQTCASSEDSPGCRKRAADEQKRRRDSPAAPLNNDTHKTHTKLHPHADGHGHTRRHFWRPYQEIWSSPGLSVTEHKLMRTTVSVSVCVCVCVCVRSVSYLDVPVTNVRWNRSWDLTGDGGGYQLLTPLYMWTCRTEQKDTVKTLICINKLLFPNSIPSIPLPLRKVKMNSSCIDVSH